MSRRKSITNRRAVRDFLLEEAAKWNPGKPKKRVSARTLDEIEASFRRFLIAQAAQDFPGRSTPITP